MKKTLKTFLLTILFFVALALFSNVKANSIASPQRQRTRIIIMSSILSPIFIYITFKILFTVSSTDNKFNLGITKNELKRNTFYFRDIPCVNIYKAYFLAYKGDLLKNKTDILGAIILKWIKDDIVKIQNINNKISIVLLETDTSKITNNKEFDLYEMFAQASMDGILENKEFESWCFTNYNKILGWFDEIIKSEQKKLISSGDIILEEKKSMYNFQPALTEELRQISGLKNYLMDYTLIKDREAIEVHLFEEYLIYAQMLGIANQVAKQFKQLYPNIIIETSFLSYNSLLDVNTWCTNSIESANTAKLKAENNQSNNF